MKRVLLFAATFVAALSVHYAAAEPKMTPLDKSRIEELKGELNSTTTGYALPISNRAAWDKLAANPSNSGVVKAAEKIVATPFPKWDGALMEQFLETGIRKIADDMYKSRSSRLLPLAVAECFENKGRFIPAIEQTLNEYCDQPTWVMVAHDPNLDNYFGREYHVDLGASGFADNIGQTLYMLGDKLDPKCVARVKEKLNERVYQPVLKSYRTLDDRGSKQSWITRNNNWNLVCLAGVTSSAFATIDDSALRAEFAAAAEKYIQYGIEGFLEDGYCPEGVGYYNYGFTSLIRLRETLYRATNGKVDLFEHPRMQKIATFGQRSEIINGVYPAITDCRPGVTPSTWIQWYCNRAYGWDQPSDETPHFGSGASLDDLISGFSNSLCKVEGGELEPPKALRSYFDKADVLSCRPQPKNWSNSLGLNIKGGTNNESHNHNDVGSYTVVAGDDIMSGDMGGPTAYAGDTFSDVRYTKYRMFSSFGHPVPLVGGVEQYASAKAVGNVISRDFSDECDKVVYDIRSAYPLESLTKLERSFSYDREAKGRVVVKDVFEAKSAVSFDTALATRQSVTIKKNKVILKSDDNAVEVTIKSSSPVVITQEEVTAYAFESFTRVSIALADSSKGGFIELTYNIK